MTQERAQPSGFPARGPSGNRMFGVSTGRVWPQRSARVAHGMNLTADPIPRLVRDLAVPASVGFLFNTLFNVVDTWWAGRISTEAQAALSLSFPVFFILIAMGSGLAQGTTALIANALGSRNPAAARHYAAQAALLAVVLGLLLMLLGWWIAPSLFRILGAREEYLGLSLAYMNTVLGGSVFFLLQSVLNGGLQAQGDTRTFRNALIAGCVLNAGLDPWFLYGGAGLPPMGIAGIALATVLITAGGTVYVLYRLRRTPIGRELVRSDFKPDGVAFREIARQGLPASLNMMTVALGIFVITWFVSRFSAEGVAAYGIATRIEQMILLPTIGLNIATLTLCGHNFGAGRLDRVRAIWLTSLRYGLSLMLVGGIVLFLAAGPLMGAFTPDPIVTETGRAYLHVAALTLGSYVVLYQTVFMLQGMKQPMVGLWIGFYRQIAAPAVVFPLLAFSAGLGLAGVWWGIALVNWTAAAAAAWYGARVLRIATAGDAR